MLPLKGNDAHSSYITQALQSSFGAMLKLEKTLPKNLNEVKGAHTIGRKAFAVVKHKFYTSLSK